MGRISMPQGKGSQLHNRRDYKKIGKAIPDKDDVEYNDIAIAATESDDIIRGIDQQIKRNAKSR